MLTGVATIAQLNALHSVRRVTVCPTSVPAQVHRKPFAAERRDARKCSRLRSSETAAEQLTQGTLEQDPSLQNDKPPPGCERYSVEVKKPLGLVLEEGKNGGIFVAEVVLGGNADEVLPKISVKDELISVSAISFTKEVKYGEIYVKQGEQAVRMSVRGEDFKTVMAAISSNPAQRPVKLELQRCDPSQDRS